MSTEKFGGKTLASVSCAHEFNGAVTLTNGYGGPTSQEYGPSNSISGVTFDPLIPK